MLPRFSALRDMWGTGAFSHGLPISVVLALVYGIALLLRCRVDDHALGCCLDTAKQDPVVLAMLDIRGPMVPEAPSSSLLVPGARDALQVAALTAYAVNRASCILWLTPALLARVRAEALPIYYRWACWRRHVPEALRDEVLASPPSLWE